MTTQTFNTERAVATWTDTLNAITSSGGKDTTGYERVLSDMISTAAHNGMVYQFDNSGGWVLIHIGWLPATQQDTSGEVK